MVQIGAPSATIDSPIEHLMACHRRIEDRLDALVRAADFLESDFSSALAAITASLRFLDSSGVLHTLDEELSVFPRLRERMTAEQIAYLDSLETEHREAEHTLSCLKELAAKAVDGPVTPFLVVAYRASAEALRTLYRSHIRSEDEVLTVMAREHLTAAEIEAISAEMRARRRS